MEVFTLIIAVIALVIAGISLQRTGGIKDLRRRVGAVNFSTEVVKNDLRRRAEAVSSKTQLVKNELQRGAGVVSSKTQVMRNRTANSLERLERVIRGKGNGKSHQGDRSEETAPKRSGRTSRRGLSSSSTRSSQV